MSVHGLLLVSWGLEERVKATGNFPFICRYTVQAGGKSMLKAHTSTSHSN